MAVALAVDAAIQATIHLKKRLTSGTAWGFAMGMFQIERGLFRTLSCGGSMYSVGWMSM